MAAVDVAVLSQAPGPFDTPTPMLAMLLAAGVPTILDEPGDLDSDLKPFVRRYDWTEEGSAPAGPTDGDRGGTGGGAGPGRLGAGGRRPLPGLGPGGGLIRGADRALSRPSPAIGPASRPAGPVSPAPSAAGMSPGPSRDPGRRLGAHPRDVATIRAQGPSP